MNHSAIASKVFPAVVKISFASIFLPLILFPVNSASCQNSANPQIKVRIIRADKLWTEESAKTERTDRHQTQNDSAGQDPATSSIDCDSILFLLDIESVTILAYNCPPNTTVYFTTAQTNPGVIGFSQTQAGPFVESIVVPVAIGSSGSGISAAYYVQGLTVGNTIHYDTSPETGPTTTIEYNVIPQCNCPPIPVIP